jgi:RNA polymerase sigma-B factor
MTEPVPSSLIVGDRLARPRHGRAAERAAVYAPAPAAAPSEANSVPRRVPATSAPQARWQPRRRGAAVSTSDTEMVDEGWMQPEALLTRLGELGAADAGRAVIRAQIIEWYLPMAGFLARRFTGRGEPLTDLTQVAVIGLIKAVDRYDPVRGVEFANYAVPTITGEIKRYFRDVTWTVRVPRRLQELKQQLAQVTEDLAHLLHRSPTTAELAARLGVSQADVSAAQHSAHAYRPSSFDQPVPGNRDLRLGDSLGGADAGLDAVDRHETLRVILAGLPPRERRIITLRFFSGMTQTQIAAEIGVSQMHVSRLLTQIMTRLRAGMLGDAESVGAGTANVAHPVTNDSADPSPRNI